MNPNPAPIGIRFGFSLYGGDEGDRTLDLTDGPYALPDRAVYAQHGGESNFYRHIYYVVESVKLTVYCNISWVAI